MKPTMAPKRRVQNVSGANGKNNTQNSPGKNSKLKQKGYKDDQLSSETKGGKNKGFNRLYAVGVIGLGKLNLDYRSL